MSDQNYYAPRLQKPKPVYHRKRRLFPIYPGTATTPNAASDSCDSTAAQPEFRLMLSLSWHWLSRWDVLLVL
ncbi:hypothetical protein E4T56_gene5073 [Termitomyces sp. T112]|nr:hypothetical protein E4T56_gene5073 [Termitomyces sp. T112]